MLVLQEEIRLQAFKCTQHCSIDLSFGWAGLLKCLYLRSLCGSFVITFMIIKAEEGKGTLKPSCKAVQFVVSFSTLWSEVGRCAQMKAWSTDSPQFSLSTVQQTDSQRGLSLLFLLSVEPGRQEGTYILFSITFISCDN